MKQIKLITILVLSLLLTCCESQDMNEIMNDEYTRIVSLIPKEFDSDITLPSASNKYTVTYHLDDVLLEDGQLPFTQTEKNQQLLILITITYDQFEMKYYEPIIQLGDQESYNDYLDKELFEGVFDLIEDELPEKLVSNYTLPTFDYENVIIEYSTTCTEINRGRLVYTFPNEETACELQVTSTYNGEFIIKQIPFIMSSVKDLPKLPTVFISTTNKQEIETKEYYISGSITLYNPDTNSSPLVNIPLQIRLRGNSTLWTPKKSFKIKFDSKTKFLSSYKEKDWLLIANHIDQTLVRNYTAYELADKLFDDFSPSYQFVDVYLNEEYLGNYLLTDQIEITNDRVDIEENTTNTDTGFLIEMDKGVFRDPNDAENENIFTIDEIPFVIKSPDQNDSHYRTTQYTYIKDYFQTVLNTIKRQEDYSNLIDEKTFIDWFIVNEIYQNVDSGYSSVYFYKEAGGLLKMGPVWDFDISAGNQGHLGEELRKPEGWYTPLHYKNEFFYYLMQYDDFQEHLKERWNEVYEKSLKTLPNRVLEVSDSITYSRYTNFLKWDIIGKEIEWYTAPETFELKTYDEQVWFLYDYLQARIEWLNNEINK